MPPLAVVCQIAYWVIVFLEVVFILAGYAMSFRPDDRHHDSSGPHTTTAAGPSPRSQAPAQAAPPIDA
jgi:hypothetical protein